MKTLFLVLIGGILISCGSTQSIEVTEAQRKALDEIVTQKKYEIISDWASPLTTTSVNAVANSGLLPPGSTVNNISLIGNGNHFRMDGDSVDVYLPYFGERRLSGRYSTDAGIKLKGAYDNYKVEYNEKKQLYLIKFNVDDIQESYRIIIRLYANLKSDISVNSNYRTTINYRGNVSKLSEKSTATVTTQ
ncbi:DUF4251 domain-containing protein [Aquimarina algiphila]|uniref:DUF4251 domain-containing protein n=1 Tax=Aquimarina algiphila TaxID=2047982 RepID=UPI00232ACB0C|nr:DUF4251 domain-containing protein [Aquimarina algiphila]